MSVLCNPYSVDGYCYSLPKVALEGYAFSLTLGCVVWTPLGSEDRFLTPFRLLTVS